MPIQARREYLNAIRERYKNSKKNQKTIILNEFITNCRYNRKYAIRILNGRVEPKVTESRGAKSKYKSVRGHVENLWNEMGRMCSKKMVAGFRLWLPFYKSIAYEERKLLEKISPSSIDRILKSYRVKPFAKGMGTTQPALKNKIPLKLLDGAVTEPGYLEGDTVAHCGDCIAGSYAHTLTVTDLFCGWTETRATWTKEAKGIVELLKQIEVELPFVLVGFASDNGTEFINEELQEHFSQRIPAVEFVRRRPYKKNDNAHVEQKNYTHVRQLVGYERFDHQELVPLMNEIYRVYWSPLNNFFTPVMKLISKERNGSKIKKKYDEPKTPCERLIQSKKLPKKVENKLKKILRTKNPFFLKRQLDKKLKQFNQRVEELKKHTSAA